jgi:Fe-S oxidoreductase
MSFWVWTVLFLAAIGAFLFQLSKRFGVLLRLRKDDGRNYSLSTLLPRLKNLFVYGFAQSKFFRDGGLPGYLHILVFWGFLVLGGQVMTMFGRGWIEGFTLPGLSMDLLGGPYSLLKDFFQTFVALGVLVLMYRWLVVKPTRLYGFLPAEAKLRSQSHKEAVFILASIFSIMVSGFLYDAGLMAQHLGSPAVMEEARWSPVTAWIASLFEGQTVLAGTVSDAAWWVHNGIILVFMNILPLSKHFHIVTALPNTFFTKLEPKGRIAKSDFTAENPSFGRSQPMQFTWKQALDMYSCTECGRCSAMCPATATGKSLAPRQFLLNLRDNVYGLQSQILAVKPGTSAEFDVVVGEGKSVIDDVIWSCNGCRACEEACPVNIEYVDKIIDIRQHLVQEASRFPEELSRTFRGLENNSNPWGIGAEERDAWAEGMNIPRIAEHPSAEYLYYVGCGGAFDANNRKTTQSLAKILQKAEVSFAILGKEELCNGETARRLGNEYLFQTMAEALVQKINSYGVKKIIVNCPHCFNTMMNEYPEFGGKWEIIRAASLVQHLISSGKLKLTAPRPNQPEKKVVYHDSCYYARFNDVVDEPRQVLSNVSGINLKEIVQSKKKGTCCGAGGGRMWMEEKADQRVNHLRVDQVMTEKPDVVATSCPYCRIMIGNAITDKGLDTSVEVKDVVQLVAEQMES